MTQEESIEESEFMDSIRERKAEVVKIKAAPSLPFLYSQLGSDGLTRLRSSVITNQNRLCQKKDKENE